MRIKYLFSFSPVFLMIFSIIFSLSVSSASEQIESSAAILMYHNISNDTPASTSVSPEMFKQHMQHLADNGFTIWPLFQVLTHLANGKPVPAKTVSLTFDDAYKSVYSEAFPVLKEKGWPFTVFVTTQYIGEGYTNYMSWQQLREIREFGGDVGNHSLTHPYLVRKRNDETIEQWRNRISNEINQSQLVLHQNIGYPIWAVAYPYGEYSSEVKEILYELGYFGIGQHSGAVSRATDFQAIPRFPMATGYDDLENFAIKVLARNLPVDILSPEDGVLASDTDIPILKLRLQVGNYEKMKLRCFASGQGVISIEWLDGESDVVNVRANEAIKPGRTKYNCTAPSKTEDNVFYWFSFLWMKPEADGRWYVE